MVAKETGNAFIPNTLYGAKTKQNTLHVSCTTMLQLAS